MIQQVILNQNLDLIQFNDSDSYFIIEVARWLDNKVEGINNPKQYDILRWSLVKNNDEALEFINNSLENTRVYLVPNPVFPIVIQDFNNNPERTWEVFPYYCLTKHYIIDIDCKNQELYDKVKTILVNNNVEFKQFESKRGCHFVINAENVGQTVTKIYNETRVKSWLCKPITLKYPI